MMRITISIFKESFNQVAYPPDRSTTCQENGEWTNPIQCRNVCPPEILTQGELTLGGVTITMEFVTTVTCEAAQEAAEEDAEVRKISPRDTSIEDLESIFAGNVQFRNNNQKPVRNMLT